MELERDDTSPHLAYLVRCWRVKTEDGLVWRAVVEDPHTAERYSFADLDALFAFLKAMTETCAAKEL